ncbi:MAG: Deoxyuridine 5'-triphosphate nucleotidohydrolase [Chaenotheca gracillima]|nr:MAG: Deoxyuridine 5'-triphosphate nucleotidohydrolase [Chaenotheca gracillima]
MGLAVAKALQAKQWDLSLIDVNESASGSLASEFPNAIFTAVDVRNYDALAAAFKKTWEKFGRLDFVYANAGINEKSDFYKPAEWDPSSGAGVPDRPDFSALDINLTGVIYTSYLGGEFMSKNKPLPDAKETDLPYSIVITSSCAGLYPCPSIPLYTASKHGVLGLMRSLAYVYSKRGIRVNATCPGLVRTNILSKEVMDTFPPEIMTGLDTVVGAVVSLIEDGKRNGEVVEVSGSNTYVKEMLKAPDEVMQKLMDGMTGLIQG